MKRYIARYGLILCVLGIPTLMTCGLLAVCFEKTLFDFSPTWMNDEWHYWHEILTFSQVGFKGGYYTIEERAAPARFSHFGPHGPVFPLIYGGIGRLIGWHLYSAPLVHLGLITGAILVLIALTKPTNGQLVLVGLVLLSFWPLILFIPTNMQEGLHYACTLILAALFAPFVSAEKHVSLLRKWTLFIFLSGISIARPSWTLLFVPFFLLQNKSLMRHTVGLAILKAIFMLILIFNIYTWLAAPYPDGGFFFVKVLMLQVSVKAFLLYILNNYMTLVSIHPEIMLESLLRYQCFFLIGWLYWQGRPFRKQMEPIGTIIRAKGEILFHLCNLGAIWLVTVCLYIVGNWGDYRVCSAHLLLSLLLCVLSKKTVWNRLVWGIIFSNLLVSPIFLNVYRHERSRNFTNQYAQALSTFQEAFKDLVYTPNQNAWCNSLLTITDTHFYPYESIRLPAGIGFSTVFQPKRLQFPLRSKYLLIRVSLQKEAYQTLSNMLVQHTTLIKHTPYGDLYRNWEAHCE